MLLTLTSSDNQTFTVDREVVKHAGTVETLINAMNLDTTKEITAMTVPLPNVTGADLKMVIDWLTLHKESPFVEKADDGTRDCEDISDMDKEFLKDKDQKKIFDLLLAANYLDVKDLLEITVKTIASTLKKCKQDGGDNTPEAIRKQFGIKNDITPEQEAELRKQNEWCTV